MAAICVATIVLAAIPVAPVPPINPCSSSDVSAGLAGVLAGLDFSYDDSAQTSEGWTDPIALSGDINVVQTDTCSNSAIEVPDINLGHEDSPFIWPEGDRLHFSYTQETTRAYLTGQPQVIEPYDSVKCIGYHRSGQSGYAFDIHEAFFEEAPATPEPPGCIDMGARTIDTTEDRWVVMESDVNIERRQFITDDPEYGVDEGSPAIAPKYGASGTVMVFARYEMDDDHPGDLYLAENSTEGSSYDPFAWGTPNAYPFGTEIGPAWVGTDDPAINTVCVEDNPHVVNNLLYWDSNRDPTLEEWDSTDDCLDPDERKIWYAVAWPNDEWWGPFLLPGLDGGGDYDGDFFAVTANSEYSVSDAEVAYWISDHPDVCCDDGNDDDDCEDGVDTQLPGCLMRATWNGSTYANHELIAAPALDDSEQADEGDVVRIGEPSVTKDLRFLYFEFRRKLEKNTGSDNDTYDTSIGAARFWSDEESGLPDTDDWPGWECEVSGS